MNQPARREVIFPGCSSPLTDGPAGVTLRTFVSGLCGARNLYTGTATFEPGAVLPLHTHPVSEAVTVLNGVATLQVEGREYRLAPFDCMHIPAFVAHSVQNDHVESPILLHSSFAGSQPPRTYTRQEFDTRPRDVGSPVDGIPETLRRFAMCETYELSEGAIFCDLFAKRFGSRGICGGYGQFRPGSSLPCHTHRYDESITIVSGEALCQVQGREYRLRGYDTAFVPEGRAHRFLNASAEPMAMIWVYAGDEPDRTIVNAGYCSGAMPWPEE